MFLFANCSLAFSAIYLSSVACLAAVRPADMLQSSHYVLCSKRHSDSSLIPSPHEKEKSPQHRQGLVALLSIKSSHLSQ